MPVPISPRASRHAPADPRHLADAIDQASVDMLFERNFVPAIAGPPFAVFLWALWSSGEGSAWIVWLVAKLVSSALRVALTAAHRRRLWALPPKAWERAHLAMLFADGVVWSFLAISFAGHDTLIQCGVMLATIVGIVAVGSSVL